MDKLIELGIQKKNGTICVSWDELGKQFNKTGEQARCKVKSYLKNKGELSGMYNSNKTKILFISDFHCPFNLPKEVLKNYVNKVDILIFGGDIQDCFGISKFIKKYRKPFVDETVYTRQFMMDVIDYIKPKKVIVIKGNHEVRLINYLSNKITDDLLQLMPETPLDLIVNNGFYKYDHENKSKTYYSSLVDIYKNIDIQYTGEWYTQIGDVIFTHPKAYKSGSLATTEKSYLYFSQNNKQFNCLVTAHTHAVGYAKYGHCHFYESGCLCKPPEYNSDGGLMKPQSQGFVYITLDNNKFSYNESKLEIIE
jgi:predicted phosphodiesterase